MDPIVNLIISKLRRQRGMAPAYKSLVLFHSRVIPKCSLFLLQCIDRQNSERTKPVVSNEKLFKFLDEECPSKVNKLFLSHPRDLLSVVF
jgi:hypothetical protein